MKDKFYGISYNLSNGHIIGLGKKCLCWKIWWSKIRKRFGAYCYLIDTKDVIFNAINNSNRFKFFGIVNLDPNTIHKNC